MSAPVEEIMSATDMARIFGVPLELLGYGSEHARDVQADLRATIEKAIIEHPRSQQVLIGPSEVGTACTRKLAYKLLQTPAARSEDARWRPTVGTAVHAWLQEAFDADNAKLGWDRWHTEYRVTVGEIDGVEITGTADLYDALTGTVIDWKIPGVTTIRAKRSAGHPGEQYRTQIHLYARGLRVMGFPVSRVAIYFLPAAGEIGDGYFWSEPYDESVAVAGLARATNLLVAMKAASVAAVIPVLPKVADYCEHCPWWMPGTKEAVTQCGGVVPVAPISGNPFGGGK